MHSEKGSDSSYTMTAAVPDHDAIHPSTDCPETVLSKNDTADNKLADPEQTQSPIEVDGGYGWICVLYVFLVNAHTWGINSAYGVFLAHYLDTNTFPGASDLDYDFVEGFSLSMAQFIAPVATITTRMWGTRVTLMIGITLQTAALLGAQALCFGFGMSMQFSATVGIIPQWFTRRRSLANGIATAGSGFGGLIYSLATSAMIQRWGFGWAFRILAIVSAAACGFSAIIVRDRNKAIGAVQFAFHTELLRRLEFLLTLAWGCFSVLGYVALLFSIPDYATTVALTASQGSIVGAMFNLGGGLGRPVIGYVSDSFGRLNTALACTFLAGLFSLVIWVFARNFGVLIFYALMSGPFAATFTTTEAPVGAEVVGLQLLPSALSIFWLSVVIPSTFAEPIALWLRTDNGTNFLHAQIFVGFMFMAACICLGLVRLWKVSELESADADGDPPRQETQIRDDDAVPRESVVGTASSVPSITSKVKTVKGSFTMARV
ncbi:MFS general substrate transporter [Aspergillus eucalypticola CBS 122712]|uniref:MFS general substrate transporter n=1 Tax=Aspergillus eucalypticola (strain CBS 122712 / IBT 29274) TaxID=1448314 RepID=A0A317UP35_ASPEC|nr:MFS general substrate transporter [Aspergillus eucalypticola CBS 122712]PWY63179.1 MFS general substrate transporter [Aspergillus eucalypticola CBS 122712]